ncbi:HP0495 family protein [Halomonas sp. GXIMD04776]|uniref:HP0495 family protein n=1 Tax=Halomonas sp. GXIMD04776 TaxID=3415605 RepID=UPI003CB12DC3
MNDKSLRDLRTETPQSPPKIVFPCDYSLKIVGDASPDFQAVVVETIKVHAPAFDENAMSAVDSRNGRFQSLRVTITATGNDQLQALFASLKATGRVHMVL